MIILAAGFVTQDRDMRRRSRLAEAVFQRLRKTLSKRDKVHLLHSLVANKMLLGSGLWVLRTQQEKCFFHSTLMSYFRRSLRPDSKCSVKFLCDAEISAILEVLTPSQLHEVALIRQLRVVVMQGRGFLWDTLCDAHDWLVYTFAALDAVLAVVGDPWNLGVAWREKLESLQERVEQMRNFRGGSSNASWLVEARPENFRCARQTLCKSLKVREGSCSTFQCCRLVGALNALSVQCLSEQPRRRRHMRPTSTQLAFGSRCEVCSKEFWSTRRLRRHLTCVAACRDIYEGSDVKADDVHGGDEAAWRPAVACYGPRPFWATLRPHLENDTVAIAGGPSHEVAAQRLIEIVDECHSGASLERWFHRTLQWMASFRDDFGVVPARQHPWLVLSELAARLVDLRFDTGSTSLAVNGFTARADGRLIFLVTSV